MQNDSALVTDTRALGDRVRVIDSREDIPEDQKNRVMTESEAHALRTSSGLDLIMVNASGDPKVVKLIDYGKYRYDQQKREKEARRKQRENASTVKEVYFTPKISPHDMNTKLTRIREFLDKGCEVQIGVKAIRSVRQNLPRGMSLPRAAREDDFILRDVIRALGGEIRDTTLNIQERSVTAHLRKAA